MNTLCNPLTTAILLSSLFFGCNATAPGPGLEEPDGASLEATAPPDATAPVDAPRADLSPTLDAQTTDSPGPRDLPAMDVQVPRPDIIAPRDIQAIPDIPAVDIPDIPAVDIPSRDILPIDTGVPIDTGPSFPPGTCGEPVAATTTGPMLDLATIDFNWSMACFDRRNSSLFVFIEDTDSRGVALRFYDYLGAGGPATGDSIDLSNYRARARPFFVSTISGIALEPMWHYDRDYLAYSGTATFTQLQRSSPVGTRLRVSFRNVLARQVGTLTDRSCRDVPNGGRMLVRALDLDMTINDLCTNQDCIDWAGGCT